MVTVWPGMGIYTCHLHRVVRKFRHPTRGLRHGVDVRSDGGIPFDFFAGIGGHAAEDGRHGAVRAVFGFVVRLVVADGGEQVVVLLLIWFAASDVALPAPLVPRR